METAKNVMGFILIYGASSALSIGIGYMIGCAVGWP